MRECDGRACAPVLVVDFSAVFGGDRTHDLGSLPGFEFSRIASVRAAFDRHRVLTVKPSRALRSVIPDGRYPTKDVARRPPHGRRTGTAGEWSPAARGSPPAPAKDGPGRGPPPRGRVRSRCASRGGRTRPGTWRRRRTSAGPARPSGRPGSALVAKIGVGIGSTPSLTTITSISPTRSA